jgi:hypothetical protein
MSMTTVAQSRARIASSRSLFWCGQLLFLAGCSGKMVGPATPASAPADERDDDTSVATGAAPQFEGATAMLTQIRPRTTVDPSTADATALDAQTAWWPVEGTATFRTTPTGVDLVVVLNNCRKPYAYRVVLYAGSDCSTIEADSQPWDGTRGVLSTKDYCFASPARLYEARTNSDPKPWTIGGPAISNLIGRTIAVHDPDTNEPLACGTIQAPDEALATNASALPTLRPEVIAQMAGMCLFGPIVPLNDEAPGACPRLENVARCALDHCVAGCLEDCLDYAACLEQASMTCSAECQPQGECAMCLGTGTLCMFGFCQSEIACAPAPTPGGPCTELRECCARQGPLTESCNYYAGLMERLSGDTSCRGALYDWDVNTHFTYRSPCYPDAGAPTP